MAQIHNSALIKQLMQDAKIQINLDAVPNQLAEKIVPVMETNPKLVAYADVNVRGICANTTNGIIYTVPANKTLYITAATMAFIKDATNTSTYSMIQIPTVDTITNAFILYVPHLSLTAQSGNVMMDYGNHPIKVAAGSILYVSTHVGDANITITATISGFFVENNP